MYRYLFVTGQAHELCVAELKSVLALISPAITTVEHEELVEAQSAEPLDTAALIKKLGGTIKIAEVIAEVPDISETMLSDVIVKDFNSQLTFGISAYSPLPISLSSLHIKIKKQMEKDRSVRYVLPKEGNVLSSVVINKQKVQEYVLFQSENRWLVGMTREAQDVDDWSKRDYGRPAADPAQGMLPPKVARMMVNLTISNFKFQISNSNTSLMLLDPFCGVGTVLAEALLSGYSVVGSDISQNAIDKTRKNLEWFAKEYPSIPASLFQLMVSDATHLSEHLQKESINAIVTEPFMGALFERKGNELFQKGKKVGSEKVKNVLKGLEKLYIGAFKEWHSLLKENGVIVITLPAIIWNGREQTVKKLVDTCETLGYTLREGPYIYARPQAVVKRKIFVFRKSNIKS